MSIAQSEIDEDVKVAGALRIALLDQQLAPGHRPFHAEMLSVQVDALFALLDPDQRRSQTNADKDALVEWLAQPMRFPERARSIIINPLTEPMHSRSLEEANGLQRGGPQQPAFAGIRPPIRDLHRAVEPHALETEWSDQSNRI